MLVTKFVPVERIGEAYEAGIRDFGESRVQEFISKKPLLPQDIHWHFIGHLQTNKVKALLEVGASGRAPLLLHSLDRLELAEEIQKQAEKLGFEVESLLQVNVSREATKSGFTSEEVESALEKMKAFERIRIRGFMTIGPLTEDHEALGKNFRELREIRDRFLGGGELSMGMSSDFERAIEEGATIVRIGAAVFGERK